VTQFGSEADGPGGSGELQPPTAFAPDTTLEPMPRESWVSGGEMRFAGWTVLTLVGVGALLGIGWARWSRTPTRGLVYTAHSIIPDQTEGFISSDGRFVILTGVVGILAGLLAWRWRAQRGPLAVAGLAVGTTLGALATSLVGGLLGGGKSTGTVNTLLSRLPLRVHALGCLFIEGALALIVYLLFTLFTTPDDLGRPAAPAPLPDQALVGAGFDPQDSR
jgi:hypothetical protein